jgi:hypothetical protein
MKATSRRYAVLIAFLSLLAACGNSSSTPAPVCTQSGNMTLYTSSTGTMLLTSITATAVQNAASVPPVPVWVGYQKPPVEVILAGYPADGVDPLNYGIDIVQIGADTDNRLEYNVTFNANRSPATYQAVLRFVATDLALIEPLACQDVPVTFTVTP